MITLSLSLALALFAAQDDLDASIKNLATKLSPDGLSGRLAEAAANEWGIQAIREKIDFLLGGKTGRYERDPLGYYEDYVFSTDPAGDLRLRPERKDEMKQLAARMARAGDSMADFNRRCDELVKKLDGPGPFEKRARESWSDPGFRVAFFHRHPAELRRRSPDELAELLLLRGLETGRDGKRRVGGPYGAELQDRVESTNGALEQVRAYEKAFLKEVAKVKEAGARELLASDAGSTFVLGRLLRQTAEGGGDPIGTLTEGDEDAGKPPAVAFNVPLETLAPAVRESETVAAGLKALFEKAAAEIAPAAEPEIRLLVFMKDARVRTLLAERAMAMQKEQQAKADEILSAQREDAFEEVDGKLRVRKGRFVNDQKDDSLDALSAELNGIIEEFNGTLRQDFDRIAERCLDADVAALFEDRAGTFLLLDHRDFVIAGAVESVRRQGLDVFLKTYLVKQGDRFVVRPERAKRIEAILERAQAIKKEMEKDK